MKQYVIYCDNGLEGEKRKSYYVGTYNSLDLAEGIVRYYRDYFSSRMCYNGPRGKVWIVEYKVNDKGFTCLDGKIIETL